MTFGRPTMVTHASNVPLPSLTEEFNNADTVTSLEDPSRMGYFVQSIRLSTILEKILVQVYQPWRSKSRGDEINAKNHQYSNFDTIIDLDSELTRFESSVPSFLSWTTAGEVPDSTFEPIVMQRNVIQGR